MRPSVYTFCVLVLTLCVVIVTRPRASKTSDNATKLVPLTNPPATIFPFSAEPSEKVAPAPEQTLSPSWELRLGEIAAEPEWMQSQEELEELADGIPEDQIRAALDELSTDPSSATIIVGRRLMCRWAEKSPEEAGRWAVQLPDNDFSHAVYRELVIPWVEKDLAGAVAWVQQQPDSGNKTAAALSLGYQAAACKEAVTAISLIADLPPGQERDNLLNYSARQWATTDWTNAVTWINEVSDPALRGQMLENVTVDWAVSDPGDAAEFAATALPAGRRDNAMVSCVRFWAVSAPGQAAAWITQSLAGNLRNIALMNLIDVWGQNDPAATDAWLKRLESIQ